MTDLQPVSQVEIDRLVDGELDERQQRALLARLDRTPDGWRRCALTFLEDRAWRRQMSRLIQPVHNEDSARVRSRRVRKPTWQTTRLLAVCASWLAAFGLGAGWMWLTEAGRSPEAPRRAEPVAAVQSAQTPSSPSRRAEIQGHQPSSVSAGAAPVDAAKDQAVTTTGGPSRAESLRLLVQHRSGETEVLDVPVVDVLNAEELWRTQQRTAAERLRERLERLGHRVRTQRWLIPVPLRDGRQLVLPVEELDVQPTRFASYQ
ncbi:MAG TPA: hypothetical protein EYP14_07310 [Planctomycetaceae bacterium]|nr:hypothetical protein [Planctomycetaceae bacterium]